MKKKNILDWQWLSLKLYSTRKQYLMQSDCWRQTKNFSCFFTWKLGCKNKTQKKTKTMETFRYDAHCCYPGHDSSSVHHGTMSSGWWWTETGQLQLRDTPHSRKGVIIPESDQVCQLMEACFAAMSLTCESSDQQTSVQQNDKIQRSY